MGTKLRNVALVILASACLLQDRAGAQSPQGGDAPTLNVIAAGINSGGRDFFEDITAIREDGRRYRIELQSALSPPRSGVGFQRFIVADPDAIPTITINSPDDPAFRAFLRRITTEQHVTVNIDMDLIGLPGGHQAWRDQTDKLAKIAEIVAEERQRAKPNSTNTMLAHSAATVALSKIIDSGKGALFHSKIAASPETWNLPSDVLIMQSTGDLTSTATGDIRDAQLLNAASRNAEGWANRGNKVIRVSGRGLDIEPSMLPPVVSVALDALRSSRIATSPANILGGVIAHTAAHKLGVRDRNVEVFLPVSTRQPGEPPTPIRVERFDVPNVSPGNIIKVFEGRAGPSWQGPSTDPRRTSYDQLKDEFKKLQPPEGGGIALRATASVPVNPVEVLRASWDDQTSRVVLEERNGKRWYFPRIDPEIARTAYQSVFREKPVDPELSIGAGLKGAHDAAGVGKRPVYYAGPIEDSLFGLFLLRADVALGDIVYGGSKELKARGLDQVAGYHSLPEMYPAKYTDQPGSERWLGSDERVVIQSLPAKLVESGNGNLVYAPVPELAVRFGRTTPAERAYADIFGTYYHLLVEKVPELRDLLECARAIGIFKWLRESNIRVASTGSLTGRSAQKVLTPHQVDARKSVRLDELPLKRPLVIYGEHGPELIYGSSGSPIEVTYFPSGQVKQIKVSNNRLLRVYADNRVVPIGLEMDGTGAAAFAYEPQGEVRFIDNVKLRYSDGRTVGFQRQPTTTEIPAVEPWGLINIISRNFIRQAAK